MADRLERGLRVEGMEALLATLERLAEGQAALFTHLTRMGYSVRVEGSVASSIIITDNNNQVVLTDGGRLARLFRSFSDPDRALAEYRAHIRRACEFLPLEGLALTEIHGLPLDPARSDERSAIARYIRGRREAYRVAAAPYTWWRPVWWLGYLVALGLLVLVLFIGRSEIGDVRRWFYIGSFRFQPSFPAMILQVVAVAAVLNSRLRLKRRRSGDEEPEDAPPGLIPYVLSGLLTLMVAALVFREPDLSTAVIYIVAWMVMAFVSGVRLLYLISTGLLAAAGMIPFWQLMKEYQRQRLLVFLNPEKDPGALYNIHQALISTGSGGLWGQGYGVGSQSQLHFLRVRHTDFIFSVIGEELGFIGTMLVFFLFTLIAWRLLRAAVLAPDRFGRLLVVGVGVILYVPLLINVGMNIGLLPVTGLPLPFISYGGTALVTYMTALGLIESVIMRHQERW